VLKQVLISRTELRLTSEDNIDYIKVLTEKTNEFAVLVVGLDSLIESPNNIVASWGLPATEDNANPALGTYKGLDLHL
jgi:hypothetical protein